MVKFLRVSMTSSDEFTEGLFREVNEGGSHNFPVMNPWEKEQEFIEEARAGAYEVILLTNIGLPWHFIRKLFAL